MTDTISILKSSITSPLVDSSTNEARLSSISNPFERKNTSSITHHQSQFSRQSSHATQRVSRISGQDSTLRGSVVDRNSILRSETGINEARPFNRRESRCLTEERADEVRRTTIQRIRTQSDTKTSSAPPVRNLNINKLNNIMRAYTRLTTDKSVRRNNSKEVNQDNIDETAEYVVRDPNKRDNWEDFFITEGVETYDVPKMNLGFNPAKRSSLEKRKIEEFSISSKTLHKNYDRNFGLLNSAIFRREVLQSQLRLRRESILDMENKLKGIEKSDELLAASLKNRVQTCGNLEIFELNPGKSRLFELRKCEFMYFSVPTMGRPSPVQIKLLSKENNSQKIKVMTSETNRYPNIFNCERIVATRFFKHYAFEHKKQFEIENLFFSLYSDDNLKIIVYLEFDTVFPRYARSKTVKPIVERNNLNEESSIEECESSDSGDPDSGRIKKKKKALEFPLNNRVEMNKTTDIYKPEFQESMRELSRVKFLTKLKDARLRKTDIQFQRKQQMELKANLHEIKGVVKEKLEILRKYKELNKTVHKEWFNLFFCVGFCKIIKILMMVSYTLLAFV